MYIETEGIVLREQSTSKNGKLLTILTPQYGKIFVFANGAKSLKSPLAASSNIFTYSKFVLFKNRNRYVANSADIIELFFELRSDIVKLSLGQYFLELTDYICREDIESASILKLLTNTLYIMCKKDIPSKQIKGIFELRILGSAGFAPDLEACRICNKTEEGNIFLNLTDGYIVCGECGNFKYTPVFIPLKPGALSAMRHVLYGEFNRIFSFQLNEDTLDNFAKVCEKFSQVQLENHSFPTLDFYSKLI